MTTTAADRILAQRRQREAKEAARSARPVPPPLTASSSSGPALSDFLPKCELGRGSYAVVLRAKERRSGAVVALKKVSKAHIKRYNKSHEVMREKEALLRLSARQPEDEAQALLPVVKLYLTLQDQEDLYFVLEWCSNGDLQQLLWRYGTLQPHTCRLYAAQLVAALAFIHGRSIVHRDLKPDNVLLDARMHIKLADFAACRELKAPPGAAKGKSRESANSFVGTPEYVAPEVLDAKPATYATDWWALGCLLVRAATGKVPFQGESQFLMFQSIVQGRYTLSELVEPDLADLIRKLLVVDVGARLGTEGDAAAVRAHVYFAGEAEAGMASAAAPVVRPYFPPRSRERAAVCEPQQSVEAGGVEAIGVAQLLQGQNVLQRRAQQSAQPCPWLPFVDKTAAIVLALEAELIVGLQPLVRVMLILGSDSRLHVRSLPALDCLHVIHLTQKTGAEAWSERLLLVDTPRRIYYFECGLGAGNAAEWEDPGRCPAVRMADAILQLVQLRPAAPPLEEPEDVPWEMVVE